MLTSANIVEHRSYVCLQPWRSDSLLSQVLVFEGQAPSLNSGRLRGHEGVEAEPQLADVRARLAHLEGAHRAVRPRALQQISSQCRYLELLSRAPI